MPTKNKKINSRDRMSVQLKATFKTHFPVVLYTERCQVLCFIFDINAQHLASRSISHLAFILCFNADLIDCILSVNRG